VDLATIVSELYGLPFDEFTAARNAAAKGAPAELAPAVRRLPKPSMSAWAVNMLVRHRPKELARLLDLGEELRAAQAELDAAALRSLGDQRARLVSAVARDGRAVAEELGHVVGDSVIREVEQTLQAAMVDSTAAEALRGGCLVRPLAADGVSPAELDGATAIAPGRAPRPKRATAPDRSERRRREAMERLDAAERSAEEAAGELDAARRAVDDQAVARRGLESAIDDLRLRLDAAQRELSAHDRRTRELERERERAAKAEERAGDAAVRARAALDRLD